MPDIGQSVSDIRTGLPVGDPNRRSNERTNERTDVNSQDVDLSGSFAERAQEPARLADGLDGDALVAALPGRHPVIRSGERDPIPPHVRSAVYYRDMGKCSWCGHRVEGQPWHLDHILPWSAGGADDTTNLRVLCERHNMERGNRYDSTAAARTPATWWCTRCYLNEGFPWSYIDNDARFPFCAQHRVGIGCSWRTACRVIKGYRRWYELHGEFPTWHKVAPIFDHERLVTAWCVHCNAPGPTARVL